MQYPCLPHNVFSSLPLRYSAGHHISLKMFVCFIPFLFKNILFTLGMKQKLSMAGVINPYFKSYEMHILSRLKCFGWKFFISIDKVRDIIYFLGEPKTK